MVLSHVFVIQHRLTSGHMRIFHQEKQANVHSQKLEHQHVPKRDPFSFSLFTKSIINGFLSQGGSASGAKHRAHAQEKNSQKRSGEASDQITSLQNGTAGDPRLVFITENVTPHPRKRKGFWDIYLLLFRWTSLDWCLLLAAIQLQRSAPPCCLVLL